MNNATCRLVLVIFTSICFISCNSNKDKSADQKQNDAKTAGAEKTSPDSLYQGMRNLALNATPGDHNITTADNETKVYGVVMDWSMSTGTATLAAFGNGDASMYMSSGGAIIGGGGNEKIATAAAAFVAKAQEYLSQAEKTEVFPLPNQNFVRFYLLTNKGKYGNEIFLDEKSNSNSGWFALYEEGNKVITEMRLAQEKQN